MQRFDAAWLAAKVIRGQETHIGFAQSESAVGGCI
jgi:hypothetical protein